MRDIAWCDKYNFYKKEVFAAFYIATTMCDDIWGRNN